MKCTYLLLFLLLSCYTLHNPFMQTSYSDELRDNSQDLKINCAINKIIYASSFLGTGFEETNANDGNYNTYWSSSYSDNQWITIDLENLQNIEYIIIYWNTNYAVEYRISTSDNGVFFPQAYYTDIGTGGIQQININKLCRFIEFEFLLRNSVYGFEIKEIEIY